MFALDNAKYESERDTPAYKLFHWHFEVILPNIYLRSLDDLEANGIYTSGDDDIDEATANQNTVTMRTAAELAELLDAGCEFILSNKVKDSARLYSIIVDHLTDWGGVLNNRGSQFIQRQQDDATMVRIMSDLRKLEGLAKHIHATGIAPIPQKVRPGGLLDQLISMGPQVLANDQWRVPNEQQSKPQVNFGTVDMLADIIECPTTLGRIKKWRR